MYEWINEWMNKHIFIDLQFSFVSSVTAEKSYTKEGVDEAYNVGYLLIMWDIYI